MDKEKALKGAWDSMDKELQRILTIGMKDPEEMLHTLTSDAIDALVHKNVIVEGQEDITRTVMLAVITLGIKADRVLGGRTVTGDAETIEKLLDGRIKDMCKEKPS